MKRTNVLFLGICFGFLILFAGCIQQPGIDMSKTLEEWREHFEGVEAVAASFDGENDIKLRVMVEDQLTEEEAVLLFNEILKSIVDYSSQPDVWKYYNGYFDIIRYDEGVIYEASKLIGKDLEVLSKHNYW
ncbi:hypothetical protein [Halalkalibacter akibai]|uniref:Uncharacterized protein n=1 Tax=Halalkalibacter akibai (strain ATCC 43226 / DSM 21942 / CIP 109018 / JCM 9157 / 1139) TaxID=1236973 RepID=W4R1Q8_HALA3|nr:hypothetical protein [Halalkalibacter akibai]GAE37464.1 hypothetical protein JCM9157_4766 [Halalkalibacter akibai JCM 9157]